MIKVLVERQLKHGEDIGRLLMELHMIAVQKKGHISNETWTNAGNDRNITVLSTWQTLEDWNAWKSSKDRASILKRIEPLLAKRTQVSVYEIMSPSDYDYFIDPPTWMQEHEHPHFEG
jgi:antibiotic biosynthesis monooxygenase (ABM) superfamily enzyme